MNKVVKLLKYIRNAYLSRCCEYGWRSYVSINNVRAVWAAPLTFSDKLSEVDKLPHYKAFTADPFLFYHQGTIWLFFETVGPDCVASGLKGKIGCLKYVDGAWINQGVVLERPWHMSYPQVFEEDGHIYMIPEQSALGKGDVSLYEATAFPRGWVKRATLIDRPFADATLLRKDGHYYMACYTIPPHETAELWHAPSLLGPWERHSEWQNIHQEAKFRRCGGAFLEENGQMYRMAQDCDGGYGLRLYKVPLVDVSPERYREGEPIMQLDERVLPRLYKHTYNEIFVNGQKISVFDAQTFLPLPPFEMIRQVVKRIIAKMCATK